MLAEVTDGTIWQVDEGDFKPWPRRVHYHATTGTPIAGLRHALDLTADPNWGYQLCRGLIELSEDDFTLIRAPSGKDPPPMTGRDLATSFDDVEESPGLLLWQITNRWQAAQRAALKPYGLTHVQFVLLAALTWLGHDGPITQKQLADHAATDPMMTSQVLRTLESAGLVERLPHPTDKRARALQATPAGLALANRTVRVVEECDRHFFDPLADLAAPFTRSLQRLKSNGDPAP